MTDYYVRLVKLPIKVEGAASPNPDGSFNIYINSQLSQEKQDEVLQHELRHIKEEHFYLDMPVERMERQAGGGTLNEALHPPEGKLARFYSEDSLAAYIRTLLIQNGRKPFP
ncbi:MAG: hypothetical protein ACOX68_00555 [Candidatus Limivicinus sp.]|jgi:hypothetical protein